jgi:hypothetical protein
LAVSLRLEGGRAISGLHSSRMILLTGLFIPISRATIQTVL